MRRGRLPFLKNNARLTSAHLCTYMLQFPGCSNSNDSHTVFQLLIVMNHEYFFIEK